MGSRVSMDLITFRGFSGFLAYKYEGGANRSPSNNEGSQAALLTPLGVQCVAE